MRTIVKNKWVQTKVLRKEKTVSFLLIVFLYALLFILCILPFAFSLPQIDEVQNGEVSVERIDESTMHITASNDAIINYSSFDIGKNETVYFRQENVNANVLNRVIGVNPTELLGSLQANGNIFLVNTSGIHIGNSAKVNAHGFVASTLNISNQDFLNGNYQFSHDIHAQLTTLLNEGKIEVFQGGFIGLISGAVENQGVMIAPVGTVVIGAGAVVTVSISPGNMIQLAVDEETKELVTDEEGNLKKALILNQGEIVADGGKVQIEGKAHKNLFECIICQEGLVKADRMIEVDGVIELVANDDIRIAGKTEASGEVKIESDNDVVVESIVTDLETGEKAIVILGGEVSIHADADHDGMGSVLHESGVIVATGDGNVNIDGAAMKLGRIEVESGSIKIGAHLAPITIEGTPEYVHKVGNITIIEKYETDNHVVMITESGDMLRYSVDQGVVLEAPFGTVGTGFILSSDQSIVLNGEHIEIIAQEIRMQIQAAFIKIHQTTDQIW